MKIGVINQVDDIEKRVLLIPADVAKLIKQGHSVYIESTSGSGAFFPDKMYTDVGASIVNGSDIFTEPDIILSLNSNTTNILEVGTYAGQATLRLADAAAQKSDSIKVISIDDNNDTFSPSAEESLKVSNLYGPDNYHAF